MTTFATRVGGIPCQCGVLHYSAEVPATYENPPEQADFDFVILDRRGRRATWLDKFIDPNVEMRLLEEFIAAKADYFMEPDYDD